MSRAARTPRRTRLASLAAALGLSAAAVLATAMPAAAHDELIASDPADGSTVASLPSEVTLTFSAFPLDEPGATLVEVTDAAGDDLTAGDPVVEGTAVVQALEGSVDGEITVVWKVVSSDGHPIDGEFRFEVTGGPAPAPAEGEATEPAATAEPTAEETAAPAAPTVTETAAPTPAGDEEGNPVLPWALAGILLIAAVAAVAYLIGSRARRQRTEAAAHSAGDTPESQGRDQD